MLVLKRVHGCFIDVAYRCSVSNQPHKMNAKVSSISYPLRCLQVRVSIANSSHFDFVPAVKVIESIRLNLNTVLPLKLQDALFKAQS